MKGLRLAGAAFICLLTAANMFAAGGDDEAAPAAEAPLFRVFLKDGTTLVSYGELARVADRVVFTMPTSAVADTQLHLVDIASDRVDWERTTNYAESARSTRYLATRAETDYTALTTEIAQALNDVALTTDPARRVAIVDRARKRLADWLPSHYNYKLNDVRQMLGLMDEVIADLRAATGAERFDLRLVAAIAPPKPLEPMLPAPTAQEAIEETLTAASLTESSAERMSLLSVAVATIDRDAAYLPVVWAAETKASVGAMIAHEVDLDHAYQTLSTRMLRLADQRARAADVRGVQRLLADIRTGDENLGGGRPDSVRSMVASVEDQLDAARRLRLARDRWALRLGELRIYRDSVAGSLVRLTALKPALEDIKALAGSGPEAIGSILKTSETILRVASAARPPDELSEAHGLLLSAARLADAAARMRREAALTGSMARAWDASSAAAGALMLGARAQSDIQAALRLPQLPK